METLDPNAGILPDGVSDANGLLRHYRDLRLRLHGPMRLQERLPPRVVTVIEKPPPLPPPPENMDERIEECARRVIEALDGMAVGRRVPRIIRAVAGVYGCGADDIVSFTGKRLHVEPRYVAMTIARTLTGLSLLSLSTEFRRDHTCIMRAVKQYGPTVKYYLAAAATERARK